MEVIENYKTYVSRFRVNSSHFTVDLNTPLKAFPADVVLCMDPEPDYKSGLYAGLDPAGESDGQFVALKNESCPLLFSIGDVVDIDSNILKFWFSQLSENHLRRVVITEPKVLSQPQLFISNLVEAGIEFLSQVSRAEIVFTTMNNALYEHAFNILVRQQKPTFDEGSGIVDDEEMLRAMYREMQCKYCGRLSLNMQILDCCRRLKCQDCFISTPRDCLFCRRVSNAKPVPLVRKLLGESEIKCTCGKDMLWKEFEQHSRQCDKILTVCKVCQQTLSRRSILDHHLSTHESQFYSTYSSPVSIKEVAILTQIATQIIISESSKANSWLCTCGNCNPISQKECLKCGLKGGSR